MKERGGSAARSSKMVLYKIAVTTGDEKGSGTDARVSLLHFWIIMTAPPPGGAWSMVFSDPPAGCDTIPPQVLNEFH